MQSTSSAKAARHKLAVVVHELKMQGVSDFESYRKIVSGRATRRAYETGDCSRESKPVEAIIDQTAASRRLQSLAAS
jgi:hypothetical protein